MLNMYNGNNRSEGGTNKTLPRLAELFCDTALITSQATLLIASRASTIDDVIDRSAARKNEIHRNFFSSSSNDRFTHFGDERDSCFLIGIGVDFLQAFPDRQRKRMYSDATLAYQNVRCSSISKNAITLPLLDV